MEKFNRTIYGILTRSLKNDGLIVKYKIDKNNYF